jgi:hypothetical protein
MTCGNQQLSSEKKCVAKHLTDATVLTIDCSEAMAVLSVMAELRFFFLQKVNDFLLHLIRARNTQLSIVCNNVFYPMRSVLWQQK